VPAVRVETPRASWREVLPRVAVCRASDDGRGPEELQMATHDRARARGGRWLEVNNLPRAATDDAPHIGTQNHSDTPPRNAASRPNSWHPIIPLVAA
jgi:hypothetical protein